MIIVRISFVGQIYRQQHLPVDATYIFRQFGEIHHTGISRNRVGNVIAGTYVFGIHPTQLNQSRIQFVFGRFDVLVGAIHRQSHNQMFGSQTHQRGAIRQLYLPNFAFVDVFQDIRHGFTRSFAVEYAGYARNRVGNGNGSAGGIQYGFGSQTLVDVFGRIIKDAEHRCYSVARPARSANITPRCADIVDMHTDTSRPFRNQRAILQCIVNSLYAVVLHCNQITTRQLLMGSSRIEEGWRCVGEIFLRHVFVGFADTRQIFAVNAERHAQPHMLGSLNGAFSDAQQIRPFESLETEIINQVVALVDAHRVEFVGVFLRQQVGVGGYHRRSIAVVVPMRVERIHRLTE